MSIKGTTTRTQGTQLGPTITETTSAARAAPTSWRTDVLSLLTVVRVSSGRGCSQRLLYRPSCSQQEGRSLSGFFRFTGLSTYPVAVAPL
jgi:hypothetical protein